MGENQRANGPNVYFLVVVFQCVFWIKIFIFRKESFLETDIWFLWAFWVKVYTLFNAMSGYADWPFTPCPSLSCLNTAKGLIHFYWPHYHSSYSSPLGTRLQSFWSSCSSSSCASHYLLPSNSRPTPHWNWATADPSWPVFLLFISCPAV